MLYLDSSDNFFVQAWNAIVNFFTVVLPGFFTDVENNWIWFIVIGAGLLVIIALIILFAALGKRKKKRAKENEEKANLAALEEKSKEEEAAELARIRRERELAVRNESEMTVDELIARRAEEEKAAQEKQLEEEERKLQETFAAETAEEEPDQPLPEEALPIVPLVEEKEEEQFAFTEPEPEPTPEPAPEPKAESGEKKAATAKKGTKPAETKKETKPTDTVLYSIVYDRAAREWVVRKTGSPRAIRRLRTKAEALEYAEQLSVRQGLALQVHKKDGKFQKKN